jgi:Carboxylesterase family
VQSSGPFAFTADEERLVQIVTIAWARFARRGKPGDAGLAWPRLRHSGRYVELDPSPRVLRNVKQDVCEFWKETGWTLAANLPPAPPQSGRWTVFSPRWARVASLPQHPGEARVDRVAHPHRRGLGQRVVARDRCPLTRRPSFIEKANDVSALKSPTTTDWARTSTTCAPAAARNVAAPIGPAAPARPATPANTITPTIAIRIAPPQMPWGKRGSIPGPPAAGVSVRPGVSFVTRRASPSRRLVLW